jgi:hypothetical protein
VTREAQPPRCGRPSTGTSCAVCPICGQTCGAPLLRRDRVPVFLNRVYPTVESALQASTGRLELSYCRACQFGFNAAFDPAAVVYGPEYENEQGYSPSFSRHLDSMVKLVMRDLGSSRAVLEVGCGQGAFLRRLAAAMPESVELIGVDPCFRSTHLPDSRIRYGAVTLDQFTEELPQAPWIALSRHVIEHVRNPVEFVAALLFGQVGAGPEQLLLETPSFEWIVRNRMFVDVFYEHCSYFTSSSLREIGARAGWTVVSVDAVFGEQYFWFTARPRGTQETEAESIDTACLTAAEVEGFASGDTAMRIYWQHQIETAAQKGPVAIWGAGAKGLTLATLLDQDRSRVKCLIDLNPAKQDHFTPLSAHPILSPDTALKAGIITAFVVNPNYLDEIRLMTAGTPLELVGVESLDNALHI